MLSSLYPRPLASAAGVALFLLFVLLAALVFIGIEQGGWGRRAKKAIIWVEKWGQLLSLRTEVPGLRVKVSLEPSSSASGRFNIHLVSLRKILRKEERQCVKR